MSKLFKNTAVFSLGLAGLIIIAHLLIPHHHDFDPTSSCESSNHCHALNNLIEDKHTPLLDFEKRISSLEFPTFGFLPVGIADSSIVSNHIDCTWFSQEGYIPIHSVFLEIHTLRAPPSLV